MQNSRRDSKLTHKEFSFPIFAPEAFGQGCKMNRIQEIHPFEFNYGAGDLLVEDTALNIMSS
jgi:hypothetical protein